MNIKQFEIKASHLAKEIKELEEFRLREGYKNPSNLILPAVNLLFQLSELIIDLINELKKQKR